MDNYVARNQFKNTSEKLLCENSSNFIIHATNFKLLKSTNFKLSLKNTYQKKMSQPGTGKLQQIQNDVISNNSFFIIIYKFENFHENVIQKLLK